MDRKELDEAIEIQFYPGGLEDLLKIIEGFDRLCGDKIEKS
jgi:hypothetical protein